MEGTQMLSLLLDWDKGRLEKRFYNKLQYILILRENIYDPLNGIADLQNGE